MVVHNGNCGNNDNIGNIGGDWQRSVVTSGGSGGSRVNVNIDVTVLVVMEATTLVMVVVSISTTTMTVMVMPIVDGCGGGLLSRQQ